MRGDIQRKAVLQRPAGEVSHAAVEETTECRHCLGAGEGPPLVSGLLAGGLSSSLRWCQHTPANMAN